MAKLTQACFHVNEITPELGKHIAAALQADCNGYKKLGSLAE